MVNKAEKNVASAEKAKSDATVKTAQTTIDQLKAEMTKAKKTALQKRLDKVKAEIKAKKDKAAAEKKSQEKTTQQTAQNSQKPAQAVAQNNGAQASSGNAGVAQAETPTSNGGVAYNGYAQTPVQDNTGYVAPTPSGGSAPAQPSTAGTSQPSAGANRPAGGTSNNNSAPVPAPAVTYTGWVRNRAGQIVWSQGGFKTLDEAGSAATAWCNANATSGGWSSGAY